MRDVNYRKIWEEYNNKKIPFGYHIHHIDGNKNNNHPSNLECLSAWDHYKVHLNQGDMWAANALFQKFIVYKHEYPCYSHVLGSTAATGLWRCERKLISISEYQRRRGVKYPEVELFSDMDWTNDYYEGPFREYDNELLRDKLTDIMLSLPPVPRDVLMMSFGVNFPKKFTKKEIAKHIGKSIRTVSYIKRNALQKLNNQDNANYLKDFL